MEKQLTLEDSIYHHFLTLYSQYCKNKNIDFDPNIILILEAVTSNDTSFILTVTKTIVDNLE